MGMEPPSNYLIQPPPGCWTDDERERKDQDATMDKKTMDKELTSWLRTRGSYDTTRSM